MLINLALLPASLFIFFLSKSQQDFRMIPHTVLCALLTAAIAVYVTFSYVTKGDPITKHIADFIDRRLKERAMKNGNAETHTKEEEKGSTEEEEIDHNLEPEISKALDAAFEMPSYVNRIINNPAMIESMLERAKESITGVHD